jgi:hypothetical protein
MRAITPIIVVTDRIVTGDRGKHSRRATSDWGFPAGLYRIQGGYEVTSSGTPVSVARKDNMSPSGCSHALR